MFAFYYGTMSVLREGSDMVSGLVERLGFELEPVAVSFTDVRPEGALQFEEGKRGCVGSMLVAAAKGATVVFDEKTYGCPGGGAGLCFGDTFAKRGHPVECLLSTGDEALATRGESFGRSLGRGERFFATPELVARWRSQFPFSEFVQKYVVFEPLSRVVWGTEEAVEAGEAVGGEGAGAAEAAVAGGEPAAPVAPGEPDLVCVFANADQLSVLVTHAGFLRGDDINVLAPFGAACHSIAYARREISAERPKGVLGFFDISQRHAIPKDLLTLTLPWQLFKQMDASADESCLTTEAWERIAGR